MPAVRKTVWGLMAAFVLAGCTNPGERERMDAARTFQTNLTAETERVLAETGGVLTFTNALALAHARTLKLAQSELETKLARIARAAAFSAFLPTVAFSGNTALIDGDAQDLPMLGDMSANRLRLNSGSLIVAQPVFTPVAWIMFAESRYGVRVKDIARERAGQLLDVQTAVLFHRAAVAARRLETGRLQLESARALTNRVARLAAEGYALPADRARATARCALAEAALVEAGNEAADARAELAEILRLDPLADFKVDGASILALPPLPEKTVAEWIWDGLVTRKELYAGDQAIELRKAQVIEALAGFLPNVVLGGGGARATISDATLRGWAGSLAGTWAAFEGFRTLQQYRAAKAMRETEFRLQEDRMTAVTVAVAESWRGREAARRKAAAARACAEAARQDHAAARLRYEDGRETMSVVLDKLAVRDEAEMRLAQATYAEALADIMLRQAVGL